MILPKGVQKSMTPIECVVSIWLRSDNHGDAHFSQNYCLEAFFFNSFDRFMILTNFFIF